MCWERMGERWLHERWTDDVKVREASEKHPLADDEREHVSTLREPVEESVEVEEELARV